MCNGVCREKNMENEKSTHLKCQLSRKTIVNWNEIYFQHRNYTSSNRNNFVEEEKNREWNSDDELHTVQSGLANSMVAFNLKIVFFSQNSLLFHCYLIEVVQYVLLPLHIFIYVMYVCVCVFYTPTCRICI